MAARDRKELKGGVFDDEAQGLRLHLLGERQGG